MTGATLVPIAASCADDPCNTCAHSLCRNRNRPGQTRHRDPPTPRPVVAPRLPPLALTCPFVPSPALSARPVRARLLATPCTAPLSCSVLRARERGREREKARMSESLFRAVSHGKIQVQRRPLLNPCACPCHRLLVTPSCLCQHGPRGTQQKEEAHVNVSKRDPTMHPCARRWRSDGLTGTFVPTVMHLVTCRTILHLVTETALVPTNLSSTP